MSYVGRGGDKISWGLSHFNLSVDNFVCCDLGSHVGGFVDGLLQSGAQRVYSVDTSYGTLAWTLRIDPRVIVLERTNALHVSLPELVDLVTCDVGWTKQSKVLPHALSLLKPGGLVLSLLKPQYEAYPTEIIRGKGLVKEEALTRIISDISTLANTLNCTILGPSLTPFLGGKGKNPEFFFLLRKRDISS